MSTVSACPTPTVPVTVVSGRGSRRTLPPMVAFVGGAVAFAALYLAAGAPTPLLVLLEQRWGFSPSLLTIAFSAYAIGLLAALLVVGSLSDHIGRRPVVVVALGVETVAMVLFLVAPDIGWVIAARVLQGVATGAASSAFTAWIVELAPERYKRLGGVLGATGTAGGLALGALLSGVAVQFASDPTALVYATLAIVMAVGLLVAALANETVTRRAGALRSLIPRVAVPRSARRGFVAAIPVQTAAWMQAGLFLGLMPTIIRSIFHVDSGLLNGASAFLAPGSAAVAALVLSRVAPQTILRWGTPAILAGAVLFIAGVLLGALPLVWLGGIVGGAGFGSTFSATLRSLTPLVEVHQRAGLIAGVFVVAYLALGVPAVVAGQLVARLGLLPVILGYGGAIVLSALLGLILQARLRRTASGDLS
ncbi:MFS transporter [Galbitalea soli]|uniref:Multidrug effflux MFS transporter n=1 Tax=Galbitalea soli TaxID=1268042 RepID=A0A7C9TQW9_9MICO|nr:MFS transporter [Galbitalea soli]NEM90982.1 multidrug effflux MFS transporter [Galbitalea soli]NYJ29669.1 putative MFS family arabinose efflux permease [Galbitalea soli]